MVKIDPNIANPYEAIANIIDEWCKKAGYQDFLVRVSVGGFETTQFLQFDVSKPGFVWENDWWEGEQEVYLKGFLAVDDVQLYGLPSRPLVGENIIYHAGNELCPHCGHILRGYEGLRECYCKFCGGKIKR